MTTNIELRDGVERWAADFEQALSSQDSEKLHGLFDEVSYLRDNGALTWDFRQFHGRDNVVAILLGVVDDIRPSKFRLSSTWPAPNAQGDESSPVFEAFLDFDTTAGYAVAVINAVPAPDSPYGFAVRSLFTRLEGLWGIEEPERFPRDRGFEPQHPGQTWRQYHDHHRSYSDREPEVLVIGAGQAGLISAAYLGRLGVDTLVIDRHGRVGDNWRVRYDALTLHNPIEMNDFPGLPFPDHYPEYLSKDQVADWLEIYARYLDLSIWLSTSLVSATYDDESQHWNVVIVRDGEEKVLRPQHVVFATGGIGGEPAVPTLPGLDNFRGAVVHSADYLRSSDYDVKKAIVVGAATSAHDIALDLYEGGVGVTLLQRGPVVVNNVETANLAYAGYMDADIPTDLVDIRTYGIGLINPLREAGSRLYHQMAKERDAELLSGLEAAGLKLGDGVDGQGWLDLFFRTGGGYYFNKGASDVIVEGGIKVAQFDNVTSFTADGVEMTDGQVLEADLVVLATGFLNRRSEVARYFGDEVADRVGDVARLNSEGEWSPIYSQTGQRGLWINGGGINQVRLGSQRMALFIKGDLDGSIPDGFRRPASDSGERPHYERLVETD